MAKILAEYMVIRGGEPEDYLFCTVYGEMMSENALSCAIKKYNHKRGVSRTSIHLFRHTFARKFLVDCGGDALILQKLLGHSTLAMTKHYCAIYDTDLYLSKVTSGDTAFFETESGRSILEMSFMRSTR